MSGRRRWIRASVAVSIVFGLVAAGVGLTFAPIFDAEQVLVQGAEHLGPRQVRRISGLTVGTNVLHVDLDAAVSRLERNGWIAEASARRELPSTIIVEVRERRPVGTMTIKGQPALVMEDGTVLLGATVRRLPRIEIHSATLSEPSVSDVATALGALSETVRAQVTGATVRPDGSLALELDGGVDVTLGPPVELELKARVLTELLGWADHGGLRLAVLDVTVPQAPTARMADDPSSEQELAVISANGSLDVEA
jgi:cell division protein FtsQ